MTGPAYLLGRALLAVLLMLAFYGLALAMILLLLGGLYVEARFGKFNLQLTLFCLTGVYFILKGIVPRPDRFATPGPRLQPESQPRLFTEIRAVAAATGQAMPAEVYLVFDVNAGVTQRGGFMAFGSRRVMILGLPLLQALDVSQFRAVIAHEFGHFHGGDVRIGPWIYKTRAALGRTLQDLSRHAGVLTHPFQWYAALFFRVTHAVSRHQELLADALAARVAGADALAGGLRATHAASLVFPRYLFQNVDPVVAAGYQPPLAAGFAHVLETPEVARGLMEALEKELKEGEASPYDTHPPLRERLAALGAALSASVSPAEPLAVSLLESLPDLEVELAARWALRSAPAPGDSPPAPGPRVISLNRLAWNDVGMRVVLPTWRGFIKQFAEPLAGITPASLGTVDWVGIGRKLAPALDDAQRRNTADVVIGVAVGLALVRVGYLIEAQPGSEQTLVQGDERLDVWRLRERLTRSADEGEAWRSFIARAGIADADLGALAREDASAP